MAEELLTSIARENFSHNKYIPVLHGRSASVKPTTLILKQKRVWWKKPFKSTELRVLSKLDKYVECAYQKGFRELADSTIIRLEKKMQKKEINEVKEKHEISLTALEDVKFDFTSDTNSGDLELGMMDEEYYEDIDLRAILDSGLLSRDKMAPYLKHKLYIVTSVMYSSKFKIVGKRESRFDVSGEIDMKSKFGGWISKYGSLGGKCSTLNSKASMVTRIKKAPIFFTVCPVKYDETTRKLRIPENYFVGNIVARGINHVTIQKRQDSIEDLLDVIEDHEDGELGTGSGLLDITDLEVKLEAIRLLLVSAASKDERSTLVIKHLYMFESILSDENKQLYMNSDYSLLPYEEAFLGQIGLKLDNSTLSVPGELLNIVQDFGLIFKFLAERTPEELDELEIILQEQE